MAVNPVEVAELLEQLDGGLVADALDPGYVVRGVADQRLVADKLGGLARISPDTPLIVDHGIGKAAPGRHDSYTRRYHLQHIVVARHNQRVDAFCSSLPCSGCR